MREDYTCEICGEPTDQKIYRLVEGVKMIVCPNCQEFGDQLPRKNNYRPSTGGYSSGGSYQRKEQPAPYSRYAPKKQKFVNNVNNQSNYVKRKPRTEDLELIEDYRKLLKKTRQKNNLTQSEFANRVKISESAFKSIENSKIELLIKDAMKIEKVFNIKLTKSAYDEEEEMEYDSQKMKKNDSDFTLGDVFFKRTKGRPSFDD